MNRDISKTPSQQEPVSQAAPPAHESIAKIAYQIYVAKGCPVGQNDQILQQAKQERWYKELVEMRRAIKNTIQLPV